MVCSLVPIFFNSLQDGIYWKETVCKFGLLMQRYTQFWFLEKVLEKLFLHHILCMTFEEKYFSCYILLTAQISLSGCIYFRTIFTADPVSVYSKPHIFILLTVCNNVSIKSVIKRAKLSMNYNCYIVIEALEH